MIIDPWQLIAALLTLLVLSRIAGDNPVFRFTQYLFVGVSLGFSIVILWSHLLNVQTPALSLDEPTDMILLAAPFIVGLLLFARLGGYRIAWLANLPLGILFGVAAALAIGGAVLGTILPQVGATIAPPTAADTPAAQIGRWVLLPIGVILVLISFTYTGRRASAAGPLWRVSTGAGRWLLIASLGVFFAGSMRSYLSALVQQVSFLIGLAG